VSRIKVKNDNKNPTQEEGVKQEKFEKYVRKIKSAWKAEEKRKRVAGRPYGIGELLEH
jgi:hypothetical protein